MHRFLLIALFAVAIAFGIAFLIQALPAGRADQIDGASVAYTMVMLSLVLASLMVNWQGRFMTALRYAGIWAIIGVALLVVYAYRNDASQVFAKVMGAVMPSRAISAAPGVETFQMSQDGHYYVQADVNGRTVEFLVDTGASMIVLSKDAAEDAGVELSNLIFDRPFQTANGTVLGAVVELEEIRIGNIVRRNVSAAVVPKTNVSLLGMSYFNTLSSFSFTSDQLSLKD